jgi:hypothetical protein
MSSIGDISKSLLSAGRYFAPEPRSKAGDFLRSVGNAASEVASSVVSLDPAYAELLKKQIQVQEQMQTLSMESNIEKSRHETQMTAIRNVRVG